MTPRERVLEVLKMPWRRDPDPFAPGKREFLYHEELERRLEQAIIAAVEEDREDREARARHIDNPFACPSCRANMRRIALDSYRCTNRDCGKTWEAK